MRWGRWWWRPASRDRHAAVSAWLGAGVSPAQVVGHGVAVLLRVYPQCVAGQEEDAERRISEATRPKSP